MTATCPPETTPLTFIPELNGIPGAVMLYSKIWGSHSHNTAVESSDIDYLGVFVSPPRALLGVDEPTQTFVHEKPDYQYHEVGKFARLLLTGNPGILEMLFTPPELSYSPKSLTQHWVHLRQNRKRFLTQKAVDAYLGYCKGQLNKLLKGSYLHTTGGNFNTKWAYHLIRLALDAERIARGGEPQVWKDGIERDYLMGIRYGLVTKDEIVKKAEGLFLVADDCKVNLPIAADKEWLDSWVLSVRGV